MHHRRAVRRVLVVFNPIAGRRRREVLDRVVAALEARGIDATLKATTQRGDAETFAREIDAQAFDALIAAGGDGTINEVVNGLSGKPLPLAIVPLGTANVMAAEIALPDDPERIAQTIASGKTKAIHLGEANGRLFVMMAGIGFDAHVVAQVGPRLKRVLGKAAYVLMTLKAMFRYPFRRYRIELDGVIHEATSAVIANGHYYGGRFVCAPEARLEDADLHVCLFERPGPLNAARYAAWLVLGRLNKLPDVKVVPARYIRVVDATDEPVQGDGDILGHLPLSITAGAASVNVLAPA